MRILIFVLVGLVSGSSFADDGGVIGIKVNELKFEKTSFADGNNVAKPVPITDAESYTLTANGKEASKLMQILPSQLSVETTMHPGIAAAFNKNFKSLVISGPKGAPAVSISCEGGTLDYTHAAGDGAPKFIAYRDGARCSVVLSSDLGEGDVTYDFNPKKAICGK